MATPSGPHEPVNLFLFGIPSLSHSTSGPHSDLQPTSGLAAFPASLGHIPYPCDHFEDLQHSRYQQISLDDPDYGGVPLPLNAAESFCEDRNESRRDGWTPSSLGNHTGEVGSTNDLTEGGVPLSLNTDDTHVAEGSPSLTNHSYITRVNEAMDYLQAGEPMLVEPPTQSIFTEAASTRPQTYSPIISNRQNMHPSWASTMEPPAPMSELAPPSPTETSSTRWPGTETTQTAYELRQTQEITFENYSWVDYDVADFLERWDFQCDMGEAGLMSVTPQLKRQWLPPEGHQAYPIRSGNRDMQGLDWSALNTTGIKARMARKMLYPLQYSWNPMPNHQDHAGFEDQYMYAFKDFYSQHKAQYSHGQLRHLLAARGRNDIFYAAKNKVMHTSLTCASHADAVIDLSGASTNSTRTAGDCAITTIAVSPLADFDGYVSDAVLVAGGYGGEYALLNLNSAMHEPATEGYVTHAHESITTHVHTLNNRRTGALGVAFCSNDRNLRLLDVDTNTWTGDFTYENEINCAVTSPDGRLRAVVGDMCETLITDAERGDVLLRTRQHTGYGFACAWAADGWHVATGGEDGKVFVYDARRWDTPLASLSCEMSCARSLHFTTSQRGGPALVVAESDDVVSVYNARNWRQRQTTEFFGSVVGAASLDDGQELLVANGDRTVGGLMVFERQEYINSGFSDDEEDDDNDGMFDLSRRKSAGYSSGVEQYSGHPGVRFGLDLDDLVL